jgi:hypothetical protein
MTNPHSRRMTGVELGRHGCIDFACMVFLNRSNVRALLIISAKS